MTQIPPIATTRRKGLMSAGQAALVASYEGKFRDLDAAWSEFAQGVPWATSPDVGAVLNTALAQFAAAGGAKMQLPIGTGRQTTSLICTNWQGISLVGRKFGDFSSETSVLSWAGAGGGLQIDWRSVSGGAAYPTIAAELSGFMLEANGLAAKGVLARGLENSTFDLKIHNPTAIAFDLDVIAGTQYFDVANNRISLYFLADSAAAINASGLVIGPGSPILDTHSNEFLKLRAQFQNGIAYDIGNTDSNVFYSTYASRILGGTGYGMVFRAGASVLQRCRSNTWYRLDMPSSPLIVEGTNGGAVPSENNQILYYNLESGFPYPTIGPGATLGGFDNQGQPIGNLGLGGARRETYPPIGSTGGGGPGGSCTLRTRKVGREVDFTANFSITSPGGSGLFQFTLPYTAVNRTPFYGRSELSGKLLQGIVAAGSSIVQILDSDNAYPCASGTGSMYMNGRYETNA